jgi:hypothetical protein
MNEPAAALAEESLELLWEQIRERHLSSAFAEIYREYPELKSRAIAEATSFAGQDRPATAHGLNLRRVDASVMLASWRAELEHRQSPPGPAAAGRARGHAEACGPGSASSSA